MKTKILLELILILILPYDLIYNLYMYAISHIHNDHKSNMTKINVFVIQETEERSSYVYIHKLHYQ